MTSDLSKGTVIPQCINCLRNEFSFSIPSAVFCVYQKIWITVCSCKQILHLIISRFKRFISVIIVIDISYAQLLFYFTQSNERYLVFEIIAENLKNGRIFNIYLTMIQKNQLKIKIKIHGSKYIIKIYFSLLFCIMAHLNCLFYLYYEISQIYNTQHKKNETLVP